MSSVLIIGPNFHYFMQSIERAFKTLGWDTNILTYDTPIHPFNAWNTVRYKIAADKEALREISKENWKNEVETKYESLKPDLVFIVNGENLLPESVKKFAKHSTVSLWLFDSAIRHPWLQALVPHTNYVFCYEQDDIQVLKSKYHVDAHFLPQAADTYLYHPIQEMSKNLDIVFAGDIWQSDKRKRLLQVIVKEFGTDRKIRIWGVYKPIYKGVWSWLTRERRDIYTNHYATAETLNRAYNSARMVLNIHNEQQTNGANPKVFEICGSGAYQLCDYNPYIESLFPNGEVGLYRNAEEMIAMVKDGIENDKSAQAAAAHQIIINHHTFTHRVQEMLDVVYK